MHRLPEALLALWELVPPTSISTSFAQSPNRFMTSNDGTLTDSAHLSEKPMRTLPVDSNAREPPRWNLDAHASMSGSERPPYRFSSSQPAPAQSTSQLANFVNDEFQILDRIFPVGVNDMLYPWPHSSGSRSMSRRFVPPLRRRMDGDLIVLKAPRCERRTNSTRIPSMRSNFWNFNMGSLAARYPSWRILRSLSMRAAPLFSTPPVGRSGQGTEFWQRVSDAVVLHGAQMADVCEWVNGTGPLPWAAAFAPKS